MEHEGGQDFFSSKKSCRKNCTTPDIIAAYKNLRHLVLSEYVFLSVYMRLSKCFLVLIYVSLVFLCTYMCLYVFLFPSLLPSLSLSLWKASILGHSSASKASKSHSLGILSYAIRCVMGRSRNKMCNEKPEITHVAVAVTHRWNLETS